MQPDQGPGVWIGWQQIYDKVVLLEGTVNRLVDRHDGDRDDLKDHELRLRSLERGRWPLPTVSVLIALGALAVAIIGKLS